MSSWQGRESRSKTYAANSLPGVQEVAALMLVVLDEEVEVMDEELELAVVDELGVMMDKMEDRLVVCEVLEEVSDMLAENVDVSTLVELEKRIEVEDLDSAIAEVWVSKMVVEDGEGDEDGEGNKDDEGDGGGDNDDSADGEIA
ncbi:hypothetical protein CSAL01_04266 [Colletotrichum salicis]|uniref:Uncharacterized protein n=1 Tax=Colletotrichum salicis TaxID=1209931 RepID=A0A135TD65_9PEZI|nr:hypothetical protein CSAL01_04266 [Colletotrichum salicis]